MKKVIRIDLYQPQAVYRIPIAQRRVLTYPLPPYSTVLGFLINICGFLEDENKIDTLKRSEIAIYGSFASKDTEYVWYRNLKREYHVGRFGVASNRTLNGFVEHPGGHMPVQIDVLNEVRLTIYVHVEDQQLLNEMYENLKNPNNWHDTPHLGRAEDLAVIEGVKEVKLENQGNFLKKRDFVIGYDYYWVPKDYFSKPIGLFYRLTTVYEIQEGHRNFKYIEVYLGEKNSQLSRYHFRGLPLYVDAEKNIPVFFAKLPTGYGNRSSSGGS